MIVMNKDMINEIYPRYPILIRLTLAQVKYLKEIKKESNIPISYVIRTLLDEAMAKDKVKKR